MSEITVIAGSSVDVRTERVIELTRPSISVQVDGKNKTVTVERPAEKVVEVGLPGPPGVSEKLTFSAEAGELINSGRIVGFDAFGRIVKADRGTGIPAKGFVRAFTPQGAIATVEVYGRLNGLFGLTPGDDYFLETDGLVTSSPATSGLHQKIGTAIAPDTLLVQPELPIMLHNG